MTYAAPAPLPRSDISWLTEWRRTIDWGLITGALFLTAVGLLMSLAASPAVAEKLGFDNVYRFVLRQAIFAAVGMAVMIGVSFLDRKWARRLAALIFLAAFALLLIVMGMGHAANGAKSWLRLPGFNVQPSEVAKPSLIILVAWLLAQRDLYPRAPWAAIAFGLYAVTLLLFLLQPDVGQSALLTAAFVITFYIAGTSARWLVFFAAGGVTLAAALYAILPNVRARVASILFPDSVDRYQIEQAALAIGRGGFFGVGPGGGQVKSHIPEAHTDFILAVMGEEFGLAAILAVMGVYALMAIRGFRAAARVEDRFSQAAAAGLVSLFVLQAVINVGVNFGVVPPTGLPLPFISYGGSSMVSMGLTLGLALALVRGEGTRSRGRYG